MGWPDGRGFAVYFILSMKTVQSVPVPVHDPAGMLVNVRTGLAEKPDTNESVYNVHTVVEVGGEYSPRTAEPKETRTVPKGVARFTA